jgi:sulfate transport system permease protein
MAAERAWVSPSVLPGFGLTLGFAVTFLSAIVLIPMAALIVKGASLPLEEFWRIATEPRALASYRLTFGASLLAALLNGVFGFIIAWTLVRYRFPGRKALDAIIDLPFALPTAVSGIALATVFGPQGWIGQWLEPLGIKVAYTWVGSAS